MKSLKMLLAGLTTGLLLFGLISSAVATSYDATTDFSITNGNPNGAWSYGWMDNHTFSMFSLYTDTRLDNGNRPAWYSSSNGTEPVIWRNDSLSTMWSVAPGQLSLHPGSSGQASVLRWTAQSDGLVDISGQFLSGDTGSMSLGIRQDTNWLWQGQDSGMFSLQRTLSKNDTIDFLVFNGYYYGNTPLELTISSKDTAPVPEPATMLLLGTGLTGLIGSRIRRKKSRS